MDEILKVDIDIYNRIQKWVWSLILTEQALDLYDYIMEKREQLFTKEVSIDLFPMKIIHAGYNITLDIAPIYFMRVFTTGHGVETKMSSNKSAEIEVIRNEMIDFVCKEMGWSKEDWASFYEPICKDRNQLVAHFDATAVDFSEDGNMHSYKTSLSGDKEIKRLRQVISLMKKYLSKFKHPNTDQ